MGFQVLKAVVFEGVVFLGFLRRIVKACVSCEVVIKCLIILDKF